jgi:hypothetical protein
MQNVFEVLVWFFTASFAVFTIMFVLGARKVPH